MVRYYCDFCGKDIDDDENLSDHVMTLPSALYAVDEDENGRPIKQRIAYGREKVNYLVCHECFAKFMRVKAEIKRGRMYDGVF